MHLASKAVHQERKSLARNLLRHKGVTIMSSEVYQIRAEAAGLLSEGNQQFASFAKDGFRSLARSISALPAQWKARRDEQRRRRQILRELNAHTDRELADLGFSRADFPSILDGSYRR
jgi:uncharacterized protein YjiS (DUF1127 family)